MPATRRHFCFLKIMQNSAVSAHADNDTSLRLLRDYTQAHGAPGHEAAVRAIFLRELAGIAGATFTADKLGGVMCALKPPATPGSPRIMLTAHMDETGFIVQDITPDGFLRFAPLGGWNESTLPAQRVRVLNSAGKEFIGVISSIPKHFMPAGNNAAPSIEGMAIDIGATNRAQAEKEFCIQIGDTIVPESPWTPLANPDLFMAKAFDNRVGMAVLTQALKMLAGTPAPLPAQILGYATVQEEVGCRGAEAAGALARPDLAIVLEGPPADDSFGFNRVESQGRLGGGVQIRVYDPTAIMNRGLVAFARATAEREKIAHQVTVRRSGGTDAKALQFAGEGVPVIVLGVPARYIHSHNSILSLNDYRACLQLALAMVRGLNAGTVAEFTRFI